MSKVNLLNIIFLIVEVITFIRLTIEIFGDMNPDVIIISAIIFGAGMIGNCICKIVRVIHDSKKQ